MPFHSDRAYGAAFCKGFKLTNFVVFSNGFGLPAQRVKGGFGQNIMKKNGIIKLFDLCGWYEPVARTKNGSDEYYLCG
jgi:hypothetical protein